jgi:hypothetical protein
MFSHIDYRKKIGFFICFDHEFMEHNDINIARVITIQRRA